MQKKLGQYLGTEIDEKWYKRYMRDKMFARGNGHFWHDEKGIYFHRFLTKTPLLIPWHRITKIKVGNWHSGRWCMGLPIIKVVWRKDSQKLSSGFLMSNKKEETMKLKEELENYKNKH